VLLAVLALTFVAIAHARLMPYTEPTLNRLELMLILVSLLTLQGGGLYLFSCNECSHTVQEIVTVCTLGINVLFMAVAFFNMLGSLSKKAGRRATKAAACCAITSVLMKRCASGGEDGMDADVDGDASVVAKAAPTTTGVAVSVNAVSDAAPTSA